MKSNYVFSCIHIVIMLVLFYINNLCFGQHESLSIGLIGHGLVEVLNNWCTVVKDVQSLDVISSYSLVGYILIDFILSHVFYTFALLVQFNKMLILLVFSHIWTKLFLTNFMQKHKLRKFNGSYLVLGKVLIKLILSNKKKIFFIFLIIWLCLFIINVIIYYNISKEIDIMDKIILMTYTMPYFTYLYNILKKKIFNQAIGSKDWNLFNNFVVQNTNIYRLSARILIILTCNYVPLFYIVIIILLLLSCIFYYVFLYRAYERIPSDIPNSNILLLKSSLGPEALTISIVGSLALAVDLGYYQAEISGETDLGQSVGIDKINDVIVKEYDIRTGDSIKTRSTKSYYYNRHKSTHALQYKWTKSSFAQRPFGNILNNIKNWTESNGDEIGRIYEINDYKIKYKLLSLIDHDDIKGALVLLYCGSIQQPIYNKVILSGVMLRDIEDLDSSSLTKYTNKFYPNFNTKGVGLNDTYKELSDKYGFHPIQVPGTDTISSIVIFTRSEPVDPILLPGIFKVWRPFTNYKDIESNYSDHTIKDYLNLDSNKAWVESHGLIRTNRYINNLDPSTDEGKKAVIGTIQNIGIEQTDPITRNTLGYDIAREAINKAIQKLYLTYFDKGKHEYFNHTEVSTREDRENTFFKMEPNRMNYLHENNIFAKINNRNLYLDEISKKRLIFNGTSISPKGLNITFCRQGIEVEVLLKEDSYEHRQPLSYSVVKTFDVVYPGIGIKEGYKHTLNLTNPEDLKTYEKLNKHFIHRFFTR